VLASLCRRVETVAIISGRPTRQLEGLLPVRCLTFVGLYGLPEDEGRDRITASLGDVETAARLVPGVWIEDKGASLAVHYRGADDPIHAEVVLKPILDDIARANGLSVLEGKMVVEVAAGRVPGKGAVTRSLVRERALTGCLYAGDDRPDLDAFATLDEMAASGIATVKVAVRSAETPENVLSAADVVVESPSALVRFLSTI
jgi:trehalose 6-phosphate phosphatase